jgi:DNA-directed RNA polymerase specialized sigma24 family protein
MPYQELIDAIEAARTGDPSRLEAWIDRHLQPLCRRLERMLGGDRELAETAAGDLLVEAWLAVDSGHRIRHPRSWCVAVLRRVVARHRRGRNRSSLQEPDPEGPDTYRRSALSIDAPDPSAADVARRPCEPGGCGGMLRSPGARDEEWRPGQGGRP